MDGDEMINAFVLLLLRPRLEALEVGGTAQEAGIRYSRFIRSREVTTGIVENPALPRQGTIGSIT